MVRVRNGVGEAGFVRYEALAELTAVIQAVELALDGKLAACPTRARRRLDGKLAACPTRTRRARSQAGFTLTEVLISVFVLSFGILVGVLSVFRFGVRASNETLDRSASAGAAAMAVAALQYRLETAEFAKETGVREYPSSAATDAYDVGPAKYKWNAVLSPLPESWALTPDTGTDERELALVQIAFFEGGPLAHVGSGTFTKDSATVTCTTLPTKLEVGCYIRRTATPESRWYLVEEITSSVGSSQLTLSEDFEDATGTGAFLYTTQLHQTLLALR